MAFTLTVLGSATPYPRPGNACSGYLLRADDAAVWVDTGPGSFANLQRHIDPVELSAIWLSHLHVDHCVDLLSAYYAFVFSATRPAAPVPVYGPPGWAAHMAAFATVVEPNPMDRAFDVHELHDGDTVDVRGVRLTSRAVSHSVPAFGLRAEYGGAAVAYSGDTMPCDGLGALARGADLLLCETGASEPGDPGVHSTPEDAADTAARADVGRLVLTHVTPRVTPADAVKRAAARYDGQVSAARDGAVHVIG
jgi:ribonuclease BN (tRNA processing enzyme)